MRVKAVNRLTKKLIGIFDSPAEAARKTKCDRSHVSKVLRGVRPHTSGITFTYVDDDLYGVNSDEVISEELEVQSTLTAVGSDNKIMNIDEYCEHHNLPRGDIKSYKLITHTGVPFYNLDFKENIVEEQILDIDFDSIVKKCLTLTDGVTQKTPPAQKSKKVKSYKLLDKTDFTRVIYTDVHIGMNPNSEGDSQYGGLYNREEVIRRVEEMAEVIRNKSTAQVLLIDELGDYMDGLDGQTVRGGHNLPQNMSNQQAFDLAVESKILLFDLLHDNYEEIIAHSICDDNHSGDFAYFVNRAVKSILDAKYGGKIKYNIQTKFMAHYHAGFHTFILTHGKDGKNMKFGYPVNPKAEHLAKIDEYCKHNDIYRNSKYIEFSKGDSHQSLMDYTSSSDFDYCNYPSFAPSSQWIQVNYKKGRSGFVIQNFDGDSEHKSVYNHWFKWSK